MGVTEATEEDIRGIRSVVKASWDADYPDTISRETVTKGLEEWYSEEYLADVIAAPKMLVLVDRAGDELAGFVHAVVDGEVGVILRLYVDPEYRREGRGGALFERMRDELEMYDVDRIRALVLEDNDTGNEFYRTVGMSIVSTDETQIAGERFEENTYELES